MSTYKINRDYWSKFSFDEQMGNIGSEVGRSITARRAGDAERFDGALARALDLFDATTELLLTQKSPHVREVCVARERYLNLFFGDPPEGDEQNVENYFTQFAIAARRGR